MTKNNLGKLHTTIITSRNNNKLTKNSHAGKMTKRGIKADIRKYMDTLAKVTAEAADQENLLKLHTVITKLFRRGIRKQTGQATTNRR